MDDDDADLCLSKSTALDIVTHFEYGESDNYLETGFVIQVHIPSQSGDKKSVDK